MLAITGLCHQVFNQPFLYYFFYQVVKEGEPISIYTQEIKTNSNQVHLDLKGLDCTVGAVFTEQLFTVKRVVGSILARNKILCGPLIVVTGMGVM